MPVVQASDADRSLRRAASRWGSKIGGRWWGGANAPGGWAGYRRPHRGWAVPGYWNAPRFYVGDWSNYGLAQPPQGYNWARYYDDAVLIDARGSVYDTTSDIDWDRAGGRRLCRRSAHATMRANDIGLCEPERPRRTSTPYADRPRRAATTGLGGAAIGAVAGGVAGNVIGGRGNRLGGTLIGAGVGAAAGYAIDKAEDRGRRAPPPPPFGVMAPAMHRRRPTQRCGDTPQTMRRLRRAVHAADYPPPPPSYDAEYRATASLHRGTGRHLDVAGRRLRR